MISTSKNFSKIFLLLQFLQIYSYYFFLSLSQSFATIYTIYQYNYKFEEDTDKKHIGFVIGDEGGDYKTPEEELPQTTKL